MLGLLSAQEIFRPHGHQPFLICRLIKLQHIIETHDTRSEKAGRRWQWRVLARFSVRPWSVPVELVLTFAGFVERPITKLFLAFTDLSWSHICYHGNIAYPSRVLTPRVMADAQLRDAVRRSRLEHWFSTPSSNYVRSERHYHGVPAGWVASQDSYKAEVSNRRTFQPIVMILSTVSPAASMLVHHTNEMYCFTTITETSSYLHPIKSRCINRDVCLGILMRLLSRMLNREGWYVITNIS